MTTYVFANSEPIMVQITDKHRRRPAPMSWFKVICAYACTCSCENVCVYMCMCTYVCVYMHTWVCMYIYVCICMCIYIYVYIYINIYVYMYIYICICDISSDTWPGKSTVTSKLSEYNYLLVIMKYAECTNRNEVCWVNSFHECCAVILSEWNITCVIQSQT